MVSEQPGRYVAHAVFARFDRDQNERKARHAEIVAVFWLARGATIESEAGTSARHGGESLRLRHC